jgi:2-enoate reductase
MAAAGFSGEKRRENIDQVKDEEIVDEGLALTDSEGRRRTLKADTVVIAVGGTPDGHLFGAVKNKFPEVYAIGDCVKPGRIWDAIHDGYALGQNI